MAKKKSETTAKPSVSEDHEVTKYQKFEVIRVHRSQLKMAGYNPRKMSPSAARRLKKTLSDSKIGLVEPIVWNQTTGNIVGGHQRITQLDILNEGEDYYLDVSKIEVDDAMEKTINISLNNPQMQGTYDIPSLEEIISDIHSKGVDLEKTGYTPTEMQTFLSMDFVSELFKDQIEDEKPDLAIMQEMFEQTKDVRQKEREEAKERKARKEALASLDEEGEDENDVEENEGEDGSQESGGNIRNEDGDSDSDDDEEDDVRLSPEEMEAEKIRKMKELKKAHRENARADQESADVLFTLVFESKDKLDVFMEMIGFEGADRMLPASDVLEVFGVEI